MKTQTVTENAEHVISYAYPTSPDASKAGFAKSGCYTYQCGGEFQGVSTLGDAKNIALLAGTIPGRWSMDHPKNVNLGRVRKV